MTDLENLYDEIHEDGIEVNDFCFSKSKKAACFKQGVYESIILDKSKIESSVEEFCLLAEEHAHYETGTLEFITATCNMPTARINRIIGEGKAQRHFITKHIPFKKLTADFHRFVYADGLDIYELAEHLNVTPEKAKEAIEYYHKKGFQW